MGKPKAYVGIDPGQTGAIAVLSDGGIPKVWEWPGDEIAAAEIVREIVFSFDVCLCALEAVSAMPKQGVSSTFKFGANWGIWRGILAALQVPFILVRPQEWQKNIVPKKASPDEKPSLAVARRMFPDVDMHRKKDHGMADALLLAYYAKQHGKLASVCREAEETFL